MYMWYDALISGIWRVHMYAMTHIKRAIQKKPRLIFLELKYTAGGEGDGDWGIFRVSTKYQYRLPWLGLSRQNLVCGMTLLYLWHDSFVCVMWLIHVYDMTRMCVWHDSLLCVTWLVMYVRVTWLDVCVCVWHDCLLMRVWHDLLIWYVHWCMTEWCMSWHHSVIHMYDWVMCMTEWCMTEWYMWLSDVMIYDSYICMTEWCV